MANADVIACKMLIIQFGNLDFLNLSFMCYVTVRHVTLEKVHNLEKSWNLNWNFSRHPVKSMLYLEIDFQLLGKSLLRNVTNH